jgi:hypothetical protein
MKVAVLSESPADDAAIRILLEGILGEAVDVLPRRPRTGGWQAVLGVIPPILKELHYTRRAEALVAVVDSNASPVHDASGTACDRPDCRLCGMRKAIADVQRSLRPLEDLPPIKTAVGLAVPAIEAWCLCGSNPNVSEGAWVRGMDERHLPYTATELKGLLYDTERPSLPRETERACAEMRRVVTDLELLERKFPVGFGALLADVRAWTKDQS